MMAAKPQAVRADDALEAAARDRDVSEGVGLLADYAHAGRRAAESVLSAQRLGDRRVGRPNEESSRAVKRLGIKRCGREDSNLHEFYLTRSLV